MSFPTTLFRFARFAWALPHFYAQRLSVEEAQAIVRRRMADREANFLRLMEHGVYGYRDSPYLPLLKDAGCELGDLRQMVGAKGLEETLRTLHDAGVYVSFEEFKGRTPIVRNGRTIPTSPTTFDNPALTRFYESRSGGSTGPPLPVRHDLSHIRDRAPRVLLAYHAHGVLGVPTALWRGTLPNSGIGYLLRSALLDEIPQRWFVPYAGREVSSSVRDRLNMATVVLVARTRGIRFPRPERVGLDEADVVARWAANVLSNTGRCVIRTYVSQAVRVSLAAQARGISLAGAVFMGGGEPPTPAKVAEIVRSGARWVPSYAFTEFGHVGFGCVDPVDGNDIHLFKDALALVQFPRQVPGWDIMVDAFYFTSLLPSAPKILLNMESDDYGLVEARSCGCAFEAYGFTEHLRHIRSFRKLTSEGMTLVGSDMLRILEEVLPARFGGSALDYQLVEEEDEHGFTRLTLRVSPRLPIADEGAVLEAVLDGLAPRLRGYWRQAGTVRVQRRAPEWTSRGKLMPLHLKGRGD